MPGSRVWVAVALAVSACSSGGDSQTDPALADEQRYCGGLCKGARRCGLTASDCETFCVDDFEPNGIRIGALAEIGKCFETEACDVLAGEDFWMPCFDRASESLPPTQSLIDYCESAARSEFECNVWWGVEECAVAMKLWADDVLDQARRCQSKACDEIQECEKAVFDQYR